MKKLLGIVVLGLLLNGCGSGSGIFSTTYYSNTPINFHVKVKHVDHDGTYTAIGQYNKESTSYDALKKCRTENTKNPNGCLIYSITTKYTDGVSRTTRYWTKGYAKYSGKGWDTKIVKKPKKKKPKQTPDDNKILPAINSRCQTCHIQHLNETDFMVRVGEILAREEIEFNVELLESFVKASYPDLRKTINNIQLNCATGKLTFPEDADNSQDYKLAMIALFREGKVKEARKLICEQVSLEEYEDVYRFLYRNLEFWGEEDKQDEAILIIRNGLVKHGMIADPEINLSATLIELEKLKTG